MRQHLPPCLALLLLTTLTPVSLVAAQGDGVHWPSFRGPQASGVAPEFSTPLHWSVAKDENVRWRTPVAGLGHSSPVVWGDRIYLTTVTSDRKPDLKVGLYGDIAPFHEDFPHQWRVLAFDKKSGKLLWEQVAHEGVPEIKRHTKATHANSTPATDGRHVVAFFGSEGLYVYDVDGKLLWKKDFGVLDSGFFQVPTAQWGFASSPVISGDKVIVQVDVQKDSFIAAYRLADGTELWRTPRSDVPTWSSPTVVATDGRAQVIANGYRHIGGYDLESGRELWKLTGGGDIPVPTPIVAHDLIFISNAHGAEAPIYAIRPGASGDITPVGAARSTEHLAWHERRGGSYMQTPLVYGNELYVCRDNGVLSVFDAVTGKRHYQERLGTGRTGFTASAVAADGKIYYTSEQGEVYVLKAGPTFEVLAENTLDEVAMATPAISEGTLYFRTREHLVAIADEGAAPGTKEEKAEKPAASER